MEHVTSSTGLGSIIATFAIIVVLIIIYIICIAIFKYALNSFKKYKPKMFITTRTISNVVFSILCIAIGCLLFFIPFGKYTLLGLVLFIFVRHKWNIGRIFTPYRNSICMGETNKLEHYILYINNSANNNIDNNFRNDLNLLWKSFAIHALSRSVIPFEQNGIYLNNNQEMNLTLLARKAKFVAFFYSDTDVCNHELKFFIENNAINKIIFIVSDIDSYNKLSSIFNDKYFPSISLNYNTYYALYRSEDEWKINTIGINNKQFISDYVDCHEALSQENETFWEKNKNLTKSLFSLKKDISLPENLLKFDVTAFLISFLIPAFGPFIYIGLYRWPYKYYTLPAILLSIFVIVMTPLYSSDNVNSSSYIISILFLLIYALLAIYIGIRANSISWYSKKWVSWKSFKTNEITSLITLIAFEFIIILCIVKSC